MNKSRQERTAIIQSCAKEQVLYDIALLIIEDILLIRILCKYFENRSFSIFVDLVVKRYPILKEFKKYSTQNKKMSIYSIYLQKSRSFSKSELMGHDIKLAKLKAGLILNYKDISKSELSCDDALFYIKRQELFYMCYGEIIYTAGKCPDTIHNINKRSCYIFDIVTVGRVLKLRPIVASLSGRDKKIVNGSIGYFLLNILEELLIQFKIDSEHTTYFQIVYKELLLHCKAVNIEIPNKYQSDIINDVLNVAEKGLIDYITLQYLTSSDKSK